MSGYELLGCFVVTAPSQVSMSERRKSVDRKPSQVTKRGMIHCLSLPWKEEREGDEHYKKNLCYSSLVTI